MKDFGSWLSHADQVYKIVAKIPQGFVLTYGKVAKLCGLKSARTVGFYLHHNPDPENIPCHRVVSSLGEISPKFAFGGAKGQINKLKNEGVTVENNRVNLKKYLWNS
jgi:O-6-methylguanine DNA methyltransferase